MSEQDEQWFDALAGYSSPTNADDLRLQQALRKAAALDASAQRDELAERRLLDRLEREGLLHVASEPLQAKRTIWPRLSQVAVIVLCLGLVVELSLMPTLEQGEEQEHAASQDMSEEAASVPAVASEAELEPSLASPQQPASARMQAQGSSAKAVLAEAPAAALADRATSAYSMQSNSSLRSAKSPLAKRERQPLPELWVEDVTHARQQLQTWSLKAETDRTVESDTADKGLLQLLCDQDAACEELAATLQVLTARPWPTKPRVGEVLQLQLRQKP